MENPSHSVTAAMPSDSVTPTWPIQNSKRYWVMGAMIGSTMPAVRTNRVILIEGDPKVPRASP